MVKEFAASDFASVENVGNPTRMTVIRRPDLLAAKIQGYRRLKDYHRQVTREQKGEDWDLSKICLPAKRPSEIIEKKIRDLVTKYSSL